MQITSEKKESGAERGKRTDLKRFFLRSGSAFFPCTCLQSSLTQKKKKETDRSLPFSVENSLFFVLTVDIQFILKFYMGSGVQLHKPSVPNRHFVVEWSGVEV